MEIWKIQLRATLERNIAGLAQLDETAKAALLESEFEAVVEATEAGLPIGAAAPDFPAPESEGMSEEFEEVVLENPRALRRAQERRRNAWPKSKV